MPGAAREKDILYTLKETITDAARDAVVKEWIIHSRYVFLILVDRRTRMTILNEATEDARYRARLPVKAQIRVALAPTSVTIAEFIHAKNNTTA